MKSFPRSPVETELRRRAAEAILVLDGAMGTEIQELKLDEAGYRGTRFADWPSDLRGNNDILILSQPDAVRQLHLDLPPRRRRHRLAPTRSPRPGSPRPTTAPRRWSPNSTSSARASPRKPRRSPRGEDGRPRFVAGAIGPTNRTASISPDVSNPGFRAISFDELRVAYGEQARGLLEGGADILLIETVFDTLNAKAALYAIAELFEERGASVPVMVSGTITDLSGPHAVRARRRKRSGFRVRHAAPFSIGLNCALGAQRDARPYRRSRPRSRIRSCAPIRMPASPTNSASMTRARNTWPALLAEFAEAGLVNIVGGCCGTTPAPYPRDRRGSARQAAAPAAARRRTNCASPGSSRSV